MINPAKTTRSFFLAAALMLVPSDLLAGTPVQPQGWSATAESPVTITSNKVLAHLPKGFQYEPDFLDRFKLEHFGLWKRYEVRAGAEFLGHFCSRFIERSGIQEYLTVGRCLAAIKIVREFDNADGSHGSSNNPSDLFLGETWLLPVGNPHQVYAKFTERTPFEVLLTEGQLKSLREKLSADLQATVDERLKALGFSFTGDPKAPTGVTLSGLVEAAIDQKIRRYFADAGLAADDFEGLTESIITLEDEFRVLKAELNAIKETQEEHGKAIDSLTNQLEQLPKQINDQLVEHGVLERTSDGAYQLSAGSEITPETLAPVLTQMGVLVTPENQLHFEQRSDKEITQLVLQSLSSLNVIKLETDPETGQTTTVRLVPTTEEQTEAINEATAKLGWPWWLWGLILLALIFVVSGGGLYMLQRTQQRQGKQLEEVREVQARMVGRHLKVDSLPSLLDDAADGERLPPITADRSKKVRFTVHRDPRRNLITHLTVEGVQDVTVLNAARDPFTGEFQVTVQQIERNLARWKSRGKIVGLTGSSGTSSSA